MQFILLSLFTLLTSFHSQATTNSATYYPKSADVYISISLTNESSKSIPLIIPSVMNPNLSPYSKSGVRLKVGQKIYFRKGWTKHLLLEVTEELKDGDIIEVSSLIKKRKKELGLK